MGVIANASCHAPKAGVREGVARTVAVVGPPNSGKTTLFNRLTGLRQKVGNFPGVTVEHHLGVVRDEHGREVALVDLPGVYSLNPKSEDERVTIDVLTGRMPSMTQPDAIVLVVDSTNLNRHLVLAARVIALGLPTLVVLNMADELRKQGGHIEPLELARHLGTPVALVSATTGEGIEAVTRFMGADVARPNPLDLPVLQDTRGCREWAAKIGVNASYRKPATPVWTERLDSLFLHKVLGPVIFAAVVVMVFQTIFAVGQPLSEMFQELLDFTGNRVAAWLPSGLLESLIINGLWNGVGSVLVFLPQILLLFLVIGVLEDSGYLARAAVIADRTMARVGLNGKCFIPLLSAYACAVPAIMATRTIENKRDRIATIMIAPFMTCSARLPVYTMFIAAFLPNKALLGPFLGTRAAAMLGLYALGFVVAVVTARVLKSSVLKSKDAPFMMEMPPYRWPTLRSLGLRLVDRGKAFLVRAGTVILAVSVILWVLTNFPMHNGQPPEIQDSLVAKMGHLIEPAIAPLGFDWKIGVGLVSSMAAREVIIATLGTLYGIDAESNDIDLQAALRQDMTPAAALALVVFFAFAMQCMSTIAVVRRETNSWKWPALQFAYMTGLAYAAALVVNQALG
ncbi:MAG TPA: ferrous iron transport protein B [Terriglobales bacterium]|nr:ferrous iron transport protein B [Terriglobales bacterium]